MAASTEYVPDATVAPGRYPRVYLVTETGPVVKVRYEVKQARSNTVSKVTSAAVTAGQWHYVALGQYSTPTSTAPFQQTLWISMSKSGNSWATTRTTQTITYPDYGVVGHLMLAGLRATSTTWKPGSWKMDQLGVWDRYLMGSELTAIVNGGTGLAYPFY